MTTTDQPPALALVVEDLPGSATSAAGRLDALEAALEQAAVGRAGRHDDVRGVRR